MNVKKAIFIGTQKFKRVAPHLMIAIGIGGIVYTIVDACIKSRRLDEEIDAEVAAVEALEEELEEAEEAYEENPTEENKAIFKNVKKLLRQAKRALYMKVGEFYLKTFIVGSLSIALIVGSHMILTNRLAVTAATLVAIEQDFKDYRKAVKEKYGEEAEKEIMYGRRMTEREIGEVVDEETGEITEAKVRVAKWREGHSIYAIPFCKSVCGTMFSDNQYYDQLTISNLRNKLETSFERDEIAWLIDAYKYAHAPVTKEIVGVGWVKGNTKGDGYIHVEAIPTVFEFTPGNLENGYILDFNVDGRIENYLSSVPDEVVTEMEASK